MKWFELFLLLRIFSKHSRDVNVKVHCLELRVNVGTGPITQIVT